MAAENSGGGAVASDAPAYLIDKLADKGAFERLVITGKSLRAKKGITDRQKAVLRLLLGRVERQHSPWPELKRRIGDNNAKWDRFVGAITSSLLKSRKYIAPRAEERDGYLSIAKKAKALCEFIKDGPLDLLSCEFWDADDWRAAGCDDLSKLSAQDRITAAHTILPHWPSVTDLLRSLEIRAQHEATHAMRGSRPMSRQSSRERAAARKFIWHLGNEFELMFGSKLLGTIANLTNILFPLVDGGVDKRYVQSIFEKSPSRGRGSPKRP